MISTPLRKSVSSPTVAPVQFPRSSARKHVLPNGLILLLQEDRSAPVASVQAWINTGSIHEDRHLGSGLSHLLEHMLFKGTESRSTNAIAQAIQDEGGYINAYTSFDRTVYWIDVPKAGVRTAIDVLSDACMNSTLPADEFVKEQEVIRREFAMVADDPDRVNSQQLFSTAYREHPYREPVIGHLDLFNALTRDDVMAYYKARYVPNNLVFVVVGDVEEKAVLEQLTAYFADFPRRPLPPVLIAPEPPQLGQRVSNREFATELSRLVLSWHVPCVTHPDVPALDVLATALGEGRSSRLYREVRDKRKLAHSISSFTYVPAEPGLFGVDATTDPDKRVAAEAATREIIAGIQRDGLTAPELEKAKRVILSNQLGALVTMRGQASDLGTDWRLTGNLDFSRDYLEAIQHVSVEDVAHVARRYLRDDNCTVSTLDPENAHLPVAAAAPAPRSAGEIQRFELPNGLRLLVREDDRLPLVCFDAVFRGGLMAETARDNGLAKLFARVLLKGTTTRTAEQIAEEIEAVGGSIGSEAGNNSISVSMEVMQPDFELGLQVFADVLLDATLPSEAVEREKAVQMASIKAEDEHMTSVARNLLRATMFGSHPYALRNAGSSESVAGLTREALREFQRRYLVGRNCVLAVFGNVRAQEVKERVEALFGEMPAGELALSAPPEPPRLVEVAHRGKVRGQGAGRPDDRLPRRERHERGSPRAGTDRRGEQRPGVALLCPHSARSWVWRISSVRRRCWGLARGIFTFYVGTDPRKIDLVHEALRQRDRAAGGGRSDGRGTDPGQEKTPRQAGDRLPEQCEPGLFVRVGRAFTDLAT